MVREPEVLKVMLDSERVPASKVRLPFVEPLSSATNALASEVFKTTLLLAAVTRFQYASTALTTTALANTLPALCASGTPAFPDRVPGAAVSPGKRIWSFTAAPRLTVRAGLMPGSLVLSVTSAAVRVVVLLAA